MHSGVTERPSQNWTGPSPDGRGTATVSNGFSLNTHIDSRSNNEAEIQ